MARELSWTSHFSFKQLTSQDTKSSLFVIRKLFKLKKSQFFFYFVLNKKEFDLSKVSNNFDFYREKNNLFREVYFVGVLFS